MPRSADLTHKDGRRPVWQRGGKVKAKNRPVQIKAQGVEDNERLRLCGRCGPARKSCIFYPQCIFSLFFTLTNKKEKTSQPVGHGSTGRSAHAKPADDRHESSGDCIVGHVKPMSVVQDKFIGRRWLDRGAGHPTRRSQSEPRPCKLGRHHATHQRPSAQRPAPNERRDKDLLSAFMHTIMSGPPQPRPRKAAHRGKKKGDRKQREKKRRIP